MIVTLIHHTNGSRSIQYGQQELALSHWIETYTYQDIGEELVEKIKVATTNQVQELLAKLY